MTKGFTLLAIGQKEYGYWARNMAASIKANSDVQIQLIHDGKATKHLHFDEPFGNQYLFDTITHIPADLYTDHGQFSPGKAKIHLYDLLAFDHSIYLDVDGCCIGDISGLFDICTKPIVSHVWGYGTLQDKTFGDLMYWADAEPLWQHFHIPADARLPFLNTSFISVRKGDEAETIYRTAQQCLDNPMPLAAMRELWGKGNQPDELYFNTAMALLNYEPHIEGFDPIYFRPYREYGAAVPLDTIKQQHYFIGLWGGQRFNHQSVERYYDGVMRNVWSQVGQTNVHKTGNLMRKKFVETN